MLKTRKLLKTKRLNEKHYFRLFRKAIKQFYRRNKKVGKHGECWFIISRTGRGLDLEQIKAIKTHHGRDIKKVSDDYKNGYISQYGLALLMTNDESIYNKLGADRIKRVRQGKQLFSPLELRVFSKILAHDDETMKYLQSVLLYEELQKLEKEGHNIKELLDYFSPAKKTVDIYLSAPLNIGTEKQKKKNNEFYKKIKNILEKKANKTVLTRVDLNTPYPRSNNDNDKLKEAYVKISQSRRLILILPHIPNAGIGGSHLMETMWAILNKMPVAFYVTVHFPLALALPLASLRQRSIGN